MVRRHERYTAYRTFVVSPGSSANGRKRLPPTIGSRDVLILLLSLQAHELARNPPASLHVERPSRHGSNPLEPAMLRFRRVPPPVAAALGLAEAPAELVRDPIARRIHFDPPDPAHREPGVPCSSCFLIQETKNKPSRHRAGTRIHLFYTTVEHARESLPLPPGSTDSESSHFPGPVPE